MKKICVLAVVWLIFGFPNLNSAQGLDTCCYCDEPGYIQRGGVENFCPIFDFNDTRPFMDNQGNIINKDASYCDAEGKMHRVVLAL